MYTVLDNPTNKKPHGKQAGKCTGKRLLLLLLLLLPLSLRVLLL